VPFAFGLASLVTAYGISDLAQWVGDALAGLVVLVCGVLVTWSRRHRALGWLLIAAGWAWFLPDVLTRTSAVSATVMGPLLFLHRGVLAHSFVAYPTGRLRGGLQRGVVVAGYGVQAATGVWSQPTDVVAGAVAMMAMTFLPVAGREARGRLPRASLAAAGLLWTVIAAQALLRAFDGGADLSAGSVHLYETAVAGCALALAMGIVLDSPREEVADLVVELGTSRPGGLRGVLAAALDDPLLQIAYWVPASAQYVDEQGSPVEVAARGDRVPTVLRGTDGTPVVALLHDRRLLDDPDLRAARPSTFSSGSVSNPTYDCSMSVVVSAGRHGWRR
jgi:hypothetical protein